MVRPNKIRENDILNGKVYFYEIDSHNDFEIKFTKAQKFIDQIRYEKG